MPHNSHCTACLRECERMSHSFCPWEGVRGGAGMVARDVMRTDLRTVSPDDLLADAAEVLQEHRYSVLPVVDEDGDLVGIVSETDLLAFVLPIPAEDMENLSFLPRSYRLPDFEQHDLRDARVRDAMKSEALVTVAEDEQIGQIAFLMVKHNIAHVPVLREGRLVGQVSRNDLMRQLVHPCLGIACE